MSTLILRGDLLQIAVEGRDATGESRSVMVAAQRFDVVSIAHSSRT